MAAISVVGMGPGDPAYLLPAALKAIEEAEVLFGAPRHIGPYRKKMGEAKEFRELASPFSAALDEIEKASSTGKVAVLVSGDPCFYSYLGLLRKRFSPEELTLYPGISSFQVLMARTGTLWNNAVIMSVHGRELSEVVEAYDRSPLLVLLTDPKNTPPVVASSLLKAGRREGTALVGRDLSYPEERIDTYTIPELAELAGTEDFGDELCVMMLKKG